MDTAEKNEDKKCDWCTDEYWEKKFGKDFEKKIEEKFENWGKCSPHKWHQDHGMGGGFYFLAMIGVAVYYVQQVSGFWPAILGILKAIVWPAMLLYEVFTRLNI